MQSTVETLTSEVKTLQDEIVALDKAVAEATEQRKAEHEEFLTTQAENQACTQLIEKAKNALNKFYRPNLYKAPPKRELTMEEQMMVDNGHPDPRDSEAPPMIAGTNQPVYVQVRRSMLRGDAVPPPPPETFGAYQKKDGKSNGVMALMEEMAQKDYEDLMSASQKTRAANAKSITEKEGAKAGWQEKIETAKEDQASTLEQLQKIGEYISG